MLVPRVGIVLWLDHLRWRAPSRPLWRDVSVRGMSDRRERIGWGGSWPSAVAVRSLSLVD